MKDVERTGSRRFMLSRAAVVAAHKRLPSGLTLKPSYKSFSTFNWPICRYRKSAWASLMAPSVEVPPSKTLAAPSSSCFFQL